MSGRGRGRRGGGGPRRGPPRGMQQPRRNNFRRPPQRDFQGTLQNEAQYINYCHYPAPLPCMHHAAHNNIDLFIVVVIKTLGCLALLAALGKPRWVEPVRHITGGKRISICCYSNSVA